MARTTLTISLQREEIQKLIHTGEERASKIEVLSFQ